MMCVMFLVETLTNRIKTSISMKPSKGMIKKVVSMYRRKTLRGTGLKTKIKINKVITIVTKMMTKKKKKSALVSSSYCSTKIIIVETDLQYLLFFP